MTKERAKLIAAIDCCQLENACDMCPMIEECCDEPFTPFIEIPNELLNRIRSELTAELKTKHKAH